MAEIEVEVVPVYRLKGGKMFRTYQGVVNNLAWRLVFDRYDGYGDDEKYATSARPKLPKWHKCSCSERKYKYFDEYEYSGEAEPWWNCPVHDRKSGYLRRLHDRLVRFLIVRYPMPRLAQMEREE